MQTARTHRSSRSLALLALLLPAGSIAAAEPPSPLQIRPKLAADEAARLEDQGITPKTWSIPREAVRVFNYEGAPASMEVTEHSVAVDYGSSGVLFDRTTGKKTARVTAVAGWPAEFPRAKAEPSPMPRLVDPGVLNPFYVNPTTVDTIYPLPDGPAFAPRIPAKTPLQPTAVAEARFAGMTWKAMQPAGFLNGIEGWNRPHHSIAWSEILTQLNDHCHLEADPGDGKPTRRFTTADGLASNIVTKLVDYDGALWAACVDIYDPKAGKWGLGGLCQYDAKTARWQRVDRIDGRPVRWVTLLQKAGDDLWVGFREGDGVEGDKVAFGMGLYPGTYRPKATALVLARHSAGQWKSWSCPPAPERPVGRYGGESPPASPSTEYPSALAMAGQKVVLFSQADGNGPTGDWNVEMAWHVSLLDPEAGRWRVYDPVKDFDADELTQVKAEGGEILVSSNRGAHRFQPATETWQYLDPQSPLRNFSFETAAVAGDELWVGYCKRSFGVWGAQGISRYDEHTGTWNYMSPVELGTASAVRRIAALPNGEVWVLFGSRPWLGATVPWNFYPRENINRPVGLGRFAGGKWTFPVEEPAPDKNASRFFFIHQSDDLAAIGNRLVYAKAGTVYVGPKPWKSLAQGAICGLRPTEDGKAVEIVRQVTGNTGQRTQELEVGRLGANDDKVRFERLRQDPNHPIESWALSSSPSLADAGGPEWVTIRMSDGKQWEVGGLPQRNVLESPAAFWLFFPGEIVRLDRKIIEQHVRGIADGK
ncbi:MAG: hypothetical protein ACLP9L_18080 [Thermoguttaceae bacterium]